MENSILIRDTDVKVTDILRMLSQGYTHQQILDKYPKLSLGDVMMTASFALELIEQYVTPENTISLDHTIKLIATSKKLVNLSRLRVEYPRAYETWKTEEDERLVELFNHGTRMSEIARIHERQPGAVKSRLQKLGLIQKNQQGRSGSERERFE